MNILDNPKNDVEEEVYNNVKKDLRKFKIK
jgi:hypothetical protein